MQEGRAEHSVLPFFFEKNMFGLLGSVFGKQLAKFFQLGNTIY